VILYLLHAFQELETKTFPIQTVWGRSFCKVLLYLFCSLSSSSK